LRRDGSEVDALSLDDVEKAIDLFKAEGVDAVSICFMNAFINAEHEQRAAQLVREKMPDAYLTVSTDLLPSIRFYPRVSTTVLNSYIGPILNDYLEQLTGRLSRNGFNGLLLIMQSNGGVMTGNGAQDGRADPAFRSRSRTWRRSCLCTGA
jgi:N-methylhydantoinase A